MSTTAVQTAVALVALAIWIHLLLGRGRFWTGSVRDDRDPIGAIASRWPGVVAVVPARNEAEVIADSVGTLLRQDYPGPFSVILVDDDSSDATLAVARGLASSAPDQLVIVPGAKLPAGWTGKLWAVSQGIVRALQAPARPEYLLLTDADIGHAPDTLRSLVRRAEAGELALVSLMAKLRCSSLAERALVPAFIFFFQMLYPFAWVNNPRNEIAAAAGGCMLIRTDALLRIGGIAAIRDALIDDCALAKAFKRHGPIWLALSSRVRSIRSYASLAEIRAMVVRSAYAQLRYSPLLLAGTVVGLALTYLAPVALTFFAGGLAQYLGLVVWLMMAFAFKPTLRLYRMSALWGLALPAIAAIYMAFTLDSAYQHARGRGGMWKGRAQANVSESNVSELR